MEKSAEVLIDTSKFISKEEYDSKVKTLEAEIAGFKTVAEQAQKVADAKIAAIEEANRQKEIKTLISAKVSDAKKADELYKSFVDAKVTPEKVAEIISYIPSQEPQRKDNTELFTGKPADASANPKAGSYAKAQAYMNSVIKGASY